MRSILTTLGAASLAVILVAAFVVRTLEAPATETDDRMAAPAEVGGHMAAAADVFIETLSTDQRDQGTWELDAEQRFDWHFIPRARYGVLLKDMNPEQRTAAHGLLQSVLSSQGYLKATGVMQLEGSSARSRAGRIDAIPRTTTSTSSVPPPRMGPGPGASRDTISR